jgi:hypothetical protein
LIYFQQLFRLLPACRYWVACLCLCFEMSAQALLWVWRQAHALSCSSWFTAPTETVLHDWGVLLSAARNVHVARRLDCLLFRAVGLFAMLRLYCFLFRRAGLLPCREATLSPIQGFCCVFGVPRWGTLVCFASAL